MRSKEETKQKIREYTEEIKNNKYLSDHCVVVLESKINALKWVVEYEPINGVDVF